MRMKHFLLPLFCAFFSLALHGQKTTEFGILLGRSYYLGELNPTTHYGNGIGNFTYGAAFRYNLNKRYSLKTTLLRTNLQAQDENAELAFNLARQAEFENELTEFATNIEFNFLPYEMGSRDHFFSPYLFVGISVYRSKPSILIQGNEVPEADESASTKIAFPFGAGLKLSLGRKLNLSFEWGFRKTSDDNIDGLPNRFLDLYEQGKDYDNDWYAISAFMLTYQLSDKGPCPAYNF
ncbi:MAG: DUF6089 family protein [Vicingaceae bacterium]